MITLQLKKITLAQESTSIDDDDDVGFMLLQIRRIVKHYNYEVSDVDGICYQLVKVNRTPEEHAI